MRALESIAPSTSLAAGARVGLAVLFLVAALGGATHAGAEVEAIVTTGAVGHVWALSDLAAAPTVPPKLLESASAASDPNGLALFGSRFALVADAAARRILVMDPASDALRGEIAIAAWSAAGSVAVSPDGSLALASGDRFGQSSGLFVIENPFAVAPRVRTLALPFEQQVGAHQSAAIRFAADGTAYVATRHRSFEWGAAAPNASYVHRVEPPYEAIAASIALPVAPATETNADHAEGLALAPGEQLVLVASGDRELFVLRAPFESGMTVETLDLGGDTRCASAVAFAPDGSKALVADYCRTGASDRVQVVDAPFSTVALPIVHEAPAGGGHLPGFEEVAVAPDGSLALVTGNATRTAAGAVSSKVWVIDAPFGTDPSGRWLELPAGGRGGGAAAFGDDRLLFDGFESGDLSLWSAVAP